MRVKKVFILIIIALITGFTFINQGDVYYEISKNLDIFGKVYKEITFNYVDEINSTEFIKSGIRGMLEKLDPYTVFIDESKKSDIEILTNGKYGGIGVTIGVQNNQVKITEILDGYPAARQGLRIGDVIYEIDGFKVDVDTYDEVSPRVKGEPGTQLELKILRNNKRDTLTFKLIREEILLKSLIYADFYPPNSNNVFLKLNSFNKSAPAEIQSAIRKLREKKEIKSIILDLRGNPGGLLESAIEVSDKFLAKNQLIVSTQGKDKSSEKKYFATEEPLLRDEKLVVLINENSASASEIVAGAIQDHDRGIILGKQSFGKGLVQTVTPITNEVSLKITTAKYYTPSGRCIQKVDYSKDNKVIIPSDSNIVSDYYTDNKRKVFSAGGIMPDTTVESSFRNKFIEDLISQGFIFEFVDQYSSSKSLSQFEIAGDKNLFEEFKEYFISNSKKLKTETSKKFDELIASIEKDSLGESYQNELNILREKIEKSYLSLLQKNKSLITNLIKIELTRRYFDSKRSLEESLKYDNQVEVALKLISDEKKYFEIINKKN